VKNKPIVWIVDEEEPQLDTQHATMTHVLPDMDVRKFPAPPRMSDFLKILADPCTACLLLDQRLKGTGVANYTGIELAQYLNGIDGLLPIFILTAFPEPWSDYEDDAEYVEDILDKGHVHLLSDELSRMVSKITRRVNVYTEQRSRRAQRANELIKKSFEESLSEDEVDELSIYEVEHDKGRWLRELGRIRDLEKLVEAHHDMMKTIRKYGG